MNDATVRDNPCLYMRGVITVLNTPFDTAAEAIDHDAFARHAAYALDAGVHGFLAPAMAGEVGALSWGERIALTRTLLNTVRGRVPVIGCATTNVPDQSVALAEELTGLGCDGVMVSFPFVDEERLFDAMSNIARANPGFIMLQDWDAAGPGIPVPIIQRLFNAIPLFKCIKIEVAAAGRKYTEVLEATNNRLHVSGGWAVAQLMEGLDRGIHAFMPTAMHHSYVAIHRRYHAGDRAGARQLFYRLLPVLAFSNQSLDISILFFKRLLWRQGIYPTAAVRTPNYRLDQHQSRIADELIEYALVLEEELDSQCPGSDTNKTPCRSPNE